MAASTAPAISTYGVFLMIKKDSTWEELCPIKDYPDLGGSPELLEITTLADGVQTNILGIQSLDAMEFTCNYQYTKYQELKALEGKEYDFAVWFGGTATGNKKTATGDDGKHAFKGELTVYVSGGGVNEVVDMKISIAATTPIGLQTT